MSKISQFWDRWIEQYTGSTAYWYVPKGRVISADSVPDLQKQLRVLVEFEGRNWRDVQHRYMENLHSQGLSAATTIDPDSTGIPMSRMLKQVFTTLGFAWVNHRDAITITRAGERFISSRNPRQHVATQAQRYQIWNPMMGSTEASEIGLQPVPYLIAVIQEVGRLNIDEYNLFCAKARDINDISDSIDGIVNWRTLGSKRQHAIKDNLDNISIDPEDSANQRRTSILNTVQLNSPYSRAFWCASGLIDRNADGELTVRSGKRRQALRLVTDWKSNGYYIEFQSPKDWIATYGDPEQQLTRQTALSYYADSSQFSMIQQTLNDIGGYTRQEKREYFDAVIREHVLEEILEQNIELIEPGMRLISRQLQTEVGRIDLFARDRIGRYTIIELKKGKTSDHVFGQISRYMGWCKKTNPSHLGVRGIIIGRTVDEKLWSAIDAHDSQVDLKVYDIRMSIADARRD